LDVVLDHIVTGGRGMGWDLSLFLRMTVMGAGSGRMVALLFACSYPLFPLVVGDEGYGDKDERDQADYEFHG
jgi:hypothetical protein